MSAVGTTISQRLKLLLKSRDMSYGDLARALRLPRSTTANYCQGKNIPPPEVLVAITALFNVTVDYLLGRSDDPQGVAAVQLPDDWEEVIKTAKGHGLSPDEVRRAIDFLAGMAKEKRGR